jgi:Zn-dependent membrane protease YugP
MKIGNEYFEYSTIRNRSRTATFEPSQQILSQRSIKDVNINRCSWMLMFVTETLNLSSRNPETAIANRAADDQ